MAVVNHFKFDSMANQLNILKAGSKWHNILFKRLNMVHQSLFNGKLHERPPGGAKFNYGMHLFNRPRQRIHIQKLFDFNVTNGASPNGSLVLEIMVNYTA